MKPSLHKLSKILKLEAERGYDNRAVVGGLEKILDNWMSEARLDKVPEELIQAIAARLRDYARLAPASRAEALDGLMRRVQRSQPADGAAAPEAFGRAGARPGARPEGYAPRPHPAQASPPVQTSPTTAPAAPAGAAGPAAAALSETAPAPFIPPAAEPEPAALDASVTVLPGVGPRHAQTLARLGIHTLRDMLYYFPRRYDDYSKLKPINRLEYGEEVTVIGTIQNVVTRPVRDGKFQVTEGYLHDGTAALRFSWFNQPWEGKRLRAGLQVALSGKVDQYLGRVVMKNPECELLEQQQLSTNRIAPVYSLTAQITQRWLRKLMNLVVTQWAARVRDPLPAGLRRSGGLIDLGMAILQAHFPDSHEKLAAARQRLAFDEIFLIQLGVLRHKRAWTERACEPLSVDDAWLEQQILRLPYTLTRAQQRALGDIRQDLASARPMNRLIQGDVGSGKTIVAALAAVMTAHAGGQAVVLAPTSILAEQHYQNLLRLLAAAPEAVVEAAQLTLPVEAAPADAGEPDSTGAAVPVYPPEDLQEEFPEGRQGAFQADEPAGKPLDSAESAPPAPSAPSSPPAPQIPPPLQPGEIRLLLGATSESERAEIFQELESGAIKLLVGTHAVLEEPVKFNQLRLAVIDEQHRFGVEQRAILRAKGDNPHLLVMTATPIPRSLALTVYGDLDLSVIDELPPGRQPVETHVVPPRDRERVYALIRRQVELGRQAFIIYPLVEESENSESKAAVEEHQRLQQEVFPRLRLALLHGRLHPDEKEDVMRRFKQGELHILVSTSVVEVGVDVPNATVMLIEGANRFGLAQLHQFRGRVGRGAEKSYCILIPETPEAVENQRLQAMAQSNDGFYLAERDLEQRGPGEFLGTRQAGFAALQMASLTDVALIEKARRLSQEVFELDADLARPEHLALSQALARFWQSGAGDIS